MRIAYESTTAVGTSTVAYDDNQTQFDVWATEVVATMYVYYTPLLVVLGVLGNLASVYIFQKSKLRLQSTSQYLSALALSDTVFLLQLLAPWLSAAQLSGLFHNSGFCQIFMYISYVSCCASAWFVVAFTMERFVAVVYPLRRNSVCTVARARFAVATVALLSLLINTPVLRFAAPRDGYCNIDRDYLQHAARFNVLDTAITFTVPLTLIVILNCWITFRVCRVERARRQLRGDAGATPACPQQRVTRMLLTVSTVFVVLNLPAYTIRVCAYAYGTETDFTGMLQYQNADEVGGRWTALQQILVMFFHTNFAINFVLYCLSGQNFRRALVQTLPWYRARARRAAAVRRAAVHRARATSISSSFVSTCTDAGLNATAGAGATPATRRRSACTITGLHETDGRRLSTCTVAGAAPPARRHADRFIQRWTFDNSRQRASAASGAALLRSPDVEAIELRLLGVPSRHRARPAAPAAPVAPVATTQI